MTRPKCNYKVDFCPKYKDFKPLGIKGKADCVELSTVETEALRLKNLENLDQTEAAQHMKVSQSTFQRVLTSAYKKVSEALIYGKAIKIIERKK
ncbi:MAG TPA: DUF134 domain-containing protein [Patescibacteria group bacterium]|jgi:hypothetical protein|nr:DUF134 domain-containing protein [Patescibacteria group bacterium]